MRRATWLAPHTTLHNVHHVCVTALLTSRSWHCTAYTLTVQLPLAWVQRWHTLWKDHALNPCIFVWGECGRRSDESHT
eukprot:508210-Pyramimonas_sp.AAC.1